MMRSAIHARHTERFVRLKGWNVASHAWLQDDLSKSDWANEP